MNRVYHGNDGGSMCVVTRTSWQSGIGAIGAAACELFSRHLPTSVLATDRPNEDRTPVVLPSGRTLPVGAAAGDQAVVLFCDVLVNGVRDRKLSELPDAGVRLAHVCFDSDVLPPEWVYALNNRFDGAYLPSVAQQEIALRSGVRVPVGVLPIALPLEELLARPWRRPGAVLRIGTITAYHERKDLDLLVEAFVAEFDPTEPIELVIHSNLSFGSVFDDLTDLVRHRAEERVTLSRQDLPVSACDDLLRSFDIFVNCSRGEGYSIGAREALALGKVLVLSDIGAHRDLLGIPGVVGVRADHRNPARYPEIDGRTFGSQMRTSVPELRRALRAAADFARSEDRPAFVHTRRSRAAEFSFSKLSLDYASIIDPEASSARPSRGATPSPTCWHPPELVERVRLARADRGLDRRQKVVVPSHDGGFFSVFNAFMSHLVWGLLDDRCHMVLPDWDQARMSTRLGTAERESFCYGTVEDGNIWTKLFEPVFGCSVEQLNDAEFLTRDVAVPDATFNQDREPLLTYKHAFDLYASPDFSRFRSQYHEAFEQHVRLLPGPQQDVVDLLEPRVGERVLLAAHVKHPSHVIEQPNELLAANEQYFREIERVLEERRVARQSDEWRLFLATDQERVIAEFEAEYGEHLVWFPEARRTTSTDDERYQRAASQGEEVALGYQVQNLIAASPSSWSTAMATEVLPRRARPRRAPTSSSTWSATSRRPCRS